MRKKWLAALLAAVLVLSGCGNTAPGSGAGSSAGSSASSGEPAGSSAGGPAGSAAGASAGSEDGAGSEAPELTEEDIQAAEAAARDYYAGTVFTVEGMEYLPQGSHPFAEGECNFTVTVHKDGAAQEDRLIQLDRTETGWTWSTRGTEEERMELWDAYDENFRRVEGVSLVRGEPIPAGAYHLVCDVLVRHTDGSYLLMRRDPRKHYGGLWEATAGGSALQGEAPLDCARRELREETGIRAEELQELGRVRSADTHYVEFLCVTNGPKDGVTLQEGETVAYRWVSREEFLSLREEELVTKRMQGFLPELRG